MHSLSLEILETFDIRIPWNVELPHSTNEEIRRDAIAGALELRIFASGSDGDVGFPLVVAVVPDSFCDRGVEADVSVEVVFAGDAQEVFEDFFLAGIFARPGGVLLEGEGVEEGVDVAAAAGVLGCIRMSAWESAV